jgi:molecular chaperone GrpE (heat shock protein)
LTQAAPVSQPAAGPEISSAAKELIKLRDWVLLAKSGEIASPASVLEGLYRKLGQLLQKEGVTALEAAGPFDEERQQIIETQPTEDPSQDNVVCDTVRPGYLFNGQLVRPQEVILYTYDN